MLGHRGLGWGYAGRFWGLGGQISGSAGLGRAGFGLGLGHELGNVLELGHGLRGMGCVGAL